MRRTWFFVFCLLFLCASGLGQSTATESQGMQALVAEVRQLRKDLQTSNGYGLKAQILLYRLQVQEATVARVSQHLNDLRSQLAQLQKHRRELEAFLKQSESLDNAEMSPEARKQLQSDLTANKSDLEWLPAEEQQKQAGEQEAEQQLRAEQTKLNDLEERVDRLEKALDNPH
jgi:chromosome segregation ATPase